MKRKKGFALIITVITMAIILGIFFNYSRATRSKKKMMQSSLSNQAAEKSVQEVNGIAIYEMFLADQIITANNLKISQNSGSTLSSPLVGEATAVQNVVGYFTVKDSSANSGITDQVAAVKIWDQVDNTPPLGTWYYGNWTGNSSNLTFTTYKFPIDSYEVPVTKGGYFITSIRDITTSSNPVQLFSVNVDEYNIPILDTSSNRVKYPSTVGSPRGKIKYKTGVKAIYEITLFKNITLFKKKTMDSKTGIFKNTYAYNEVLRSYNTYVTLEIYWSNNTAIQLSDPNMRNYCSAAPNPGVSVKVGADCGVNSNGDMIVSKVTSVIVEDITPSIE